MYAYLSVNPFSTLVSLLFDLLDLDNTSSAIPGLTYDGSYIDTDAVRESETMEFTRQVLLDHRNPQILAILEQNATISHHLPPIARTA